VEAHDRAGQPDVLGDGKDMISFGKVTWTTYPIKMSPVDRLNEIDDQLKIPGWRVKDRAKALLEIERPGGIIEIEKT
jgi:hypothetical protein